MHEERVTIRRGVLLVSHPRHRQVTTVMDRSRALHLLEGAGSDLIVMARLRGLLAEEMDVSRMTDHAVLEAIGHRVLSGVMELHVEGIKRSQGKVTFAELLKNYPTNAKYPTPVNREDSIWKLVGGKVYYNATHDDPTTKRPIFVNSCATRMSRALNYSGVTIEHSSGLSRVAMVSGIFSELKISIQLCVNCLDLLKH